MCTLDSLETLGDQGNDDDEGKCSGNIIHASPSSGFVRVAGLTSAAGTEGLASDQMSTGSLGRQPSPGTLASHLGHQVTVSNGDLFDMMPLGSG